VNVETKPDTNKSNVLLLVLLTRPAFYNLLIILVARGGIEPPTQGFSGLLNKYYLLINNWLDRTLVAKFA